jgi:hypothetical protein
MFRPLSIATMVAVQRLVMSLLPKHRTAVYWLGRNSAKTAGGLISPIRFNRVSFKSPPLGGSADEGDESDRQEERCVTHKLGRHLDRCRPVHGLAFIC